MPLPAWAVAANACPVPFCVTATQLPAVEQVNVEGFVSTIAGGVSVPPPVASSVVLSVRCEYLELESVLSTWLCN
jgi:hypothetical protein